MFDVYQLWLLLQCFACSQRLLAALYAHMNNKRKMKKKKKEAISLLNI
jgi:hypothetical protein